MRAVVKKYASYTCERVFYYALYLEGYRAPEDKKYFKFFLNRDDFPVIVCKRGSSPYVFYIPRSVGKALGEGTVVEVTDIQDASEEEYFEFMAAHSHAMSYPTLPKPIEVKVCSIYRRIPSISSLPGDVSCSLSFADIKNAGLPLENKSTMHFWVDVEGCVGLLQIYPKRYTAKLLIKDPEKVDEFLKKVKKSSIVTLRPVERKRILKALAMFLRIATMRRSYGKLKTSKKPPKKLRELISIAEELMRSRVITSEEFNLFKEYLESVDPQKFLSSVRSFVGQLDRRKKRVLILSIIWALKWREGDYHGLLLFITRRLSSSFERGLRLPAFIGILKKLGIYPEPEPPKKILDSLLRGHHGFSEEEKRKILALAGKIEDILKKNALVTLPHMRRVLAVIFALDILHHWFLLVNPVHTKLISELTYRRKLKAVREALKKCYYI